MHTIELSPSMFEVQLAGAEASLDALFPAWDQHDRFGIVVQEPLGAIGASLLIQAAIARFFQYRRDPGHDALPMYPEIYAFHVGRPHGDLSTYDFWPVEKEVVVEADPVAVADAINGRAITRLAVCDGPESANSLPWPEFGSARNRIRSAWTYAARGAVTNGDVMIRSTCREAETNTIGALDLPRFIDTILTSRGPVSDTLQDDGEFRSWVLNATDSEPDLAVAVRDRIDHMQSLLSAEGVPVEALRHDDIFERWIQRVDARKQEVPPAVREDIARCHAARLRDGLVRQEFRRVTVDAALRRLVG